MDNVWQIPSHLLFIGPYEILQRKSAVAKKQPNTAIISLEALPCFELSFLESIGETSANLSAVPGLSLRGVLQVLNFMKHTPI